MRSPRTLLRLAVALAGLATTTPTFAATPPCAPCAGVTVAAPHLAVEALSQAPAVATQDGARLYVRWAQQAGEAWDRGAAERIAAAGGTPWLSIVFRTPPPLVQHVAELERELAGLASIVRDPGPLTHFEIVWEPQTTPAEEAPPSNRLVEYAFLLKRAAVVITGAQPDARVLTQPLPADAESLRALYGQEVAAYVDGVVLQGPLAPAALAGAVATLGELDPGRPVVVAGNPLPSPAELALAQSAEATANGAAISLFDLPEAIEGTPPPSLAPFVVLANEFHGDLSYDAGTTPTGASGWAFVRAKDLGIRAIVRRDGEQPAQVAFNDPLLASPEVVDLRSTAAKAIPGARSAQGVQLKLSAPVAVLRLARDIPTDLETIKGGVDVETAREMPVEEILRRLQAFDDAQARRLDHYQATNATAIRFAGGGADTVEVSFKGPFFYKEGKGFDWAWTEVFVGGVKWRGKALPEFPLIQPQKAAAMPLQIHFTKEYRYRLRGSDTLDGRAVWVVDFEPATAELAKSGALYQGTVWIDKQHYGRVRSRALQVGLTGEVISNEETVFYTPVDAAGQPTAWTPEAYWLPLRLVGQQLLNIVNSATVVEREAVISDLRLNAPDYDEQLAAVMRSESTMVRDTDNGLRYLVKQEGSDERVVKEGFDVDKIFLLGGVFYDDALDYPLPLVGANYFSFDVKGTGTQANVFFAGALLTASVAQPRLFGSKFDAGADLFALAVPLEDTVWRDDQEIESEGVETTTGSLALNVGHPIGPFLRLGASYEALYFAYGDTDETDPSFVIPSDHILHSLGLEARYSRSGYRLSLAGSYNQRSEWERWGLPGSDFDPDTEDFLRWDFRAAKSWYFKSFQRLGVEVDYIAGEDLDRFSKYQFGFFGGNRVHGYSSGKVRAEEATAAHLSYGIGVGEIVRLDLVADAAWATDEETGLDNELLGGVGIAGSFMGPWQTLVQIDVGAPVTGPDDGFVAYLVFLKLFK